MKGLRIILLIGFVALPFPKASASGNHYHLLEIDFTKTQDVKSKATWSEPGLTVNPSGLGWDGEDSHSRSGWLQTSPLALGLSWRPPYAISFRVNIEPKPETIVLQNGQKSSADAGEVYARYSPDAKHWSTWQVLQQSGPGADRGNQGSEWLFSGSIRVPNSEREEYDRLINEYSKLNVLWKSDEDAAVRWILKTNPKFFAEYLPFIGYVEFRFENRFHGRQRIKSFKVELGYSIGGIHYPPDDKEVYQKRHSTPWSFRAD